MESLVVCGLADQTRPYIHSNTAVSVSPSWDLLEFEGCRNIRSYSIIPIRDEERGHVNGSASCMSILPEF